MLSARASLMTRLLTHGSCPLSIRSPTSARAGSRGCPRAARPGSRREPSGPRPGRRVVVDLADADHEPQHVQAVDVKQSVSTARMQGQWGDLLAVDLLARVCEPEGGVELTRRFIFARVRQRRLARAWA